MQGVEFDNGDMYVDGHKAASDVRDEFVSVTEKLMDELAQCYNVPIHPLTSQDRKSGSAGMPRPISYAVFCLKKKITKANNINLHLYNHTKTLINNLL